MLKKILRSLLNRRKDSRRVVLQVPVKAADPQGNTHEVVSEDVSDRGIRLRCEGVRLGTLVGHREELPLEICLQNETPPVVAQAKLVWVYDTAEGGSVSGWRFVHFHGNARRRLRNFLDRYEV